MKSILTAWLFKAGSELFRKLHHYGIQEIDNDWFSLYLFGCCDFIYRFSFQTLKYIIIQIMCTVCMLQEQVLETSVFDFNQKDKELVTKIFW